MQRITPFLWFDNQAEEAVRFYCSIFPNSHATGISLYPEDTPGPAGSVMVIPFVLDGVEFLALNGGPIFKFTPAISMVVTCKTQEEVDELWDKLTSDGGEPGQCCWLTDKYGLSWQIVPDVIGKYMTDPNPVKSKNVMAVVMQMTKPDIAAITAAYEKE
jgi:predicted 3-demethylubiquinone-9 3-methyltransferase (glyoxalase superfamily)